MPIEGLNWSTIDDTCDARTQRRMSRDLRKFEVRSLREQVYLMSSIIWTNQEYKSATVNWALYSIISADGHREWSQLQSDNPIPRDRPKVLESDTEHKLI
jgi:hypothetical protein